MWLALLFVLCEQREVHSYLDIFLSSGHYIPKTTLRSVVLALDYFITMWIWLFLNARLLMERGQKRQRINHLCLYKRIFLWLQIVTPILFLQLPAINNMDNSVVLGGNISRSRNQSSSLIVKSQLIQFTLQMWMGWTSAYSCKIRNV